VKPRPYAWITSGILFAAATVWINYEVKVKIQSGSADGATQQLGSIRVGEPAPVFSAEDVAGETVGLGDFRGQKVVLVDFWATWCGPCRMAMPGLQSLLNDFKDRGLEILSINQGESAEQAAAFMKKKGYGFHVLLDPDSSIASRYFVRGIPTVLVVDKEGIVQWIRVGYSPNDSDLRRLLERLVKK
jgi:peroxiredoxin